MASTDKEVEIKFKPAAPDWWMLGRINDRYKCEKCGNFVLGNNFYISSAGGRCEACLKDLPQSERKTLKSISQKLFPLYVFVIGYPILYLSVYLINSVFKNGFTEFIGKNFQLIALTYAVGFVYFILKIKSTENWRFKQE